MKRLLPFAVAVFLCVGIGVTSSLAEKRAMADPQGPNAKLKANPHDGMLLAARGGGGDRGGNRGGGHGSGGGGHVAHGGGHAGGGGNVAHGGHHRPHPGRGSRSFYFGTYPRYSSGYGYPYYPDYGYPYPPVYYGWRYYYPPPLYIPAEELYGPRAVQRFMGVDQWFAPKRNVTIIVPPRNAAGNAAVAPAVGAAAPAAGVKDPFAADPVAAPAAEPNLRATNQAAQRLAWTFVGYGDAHFANQKFNDANQRYRKATQAAPQLPVGHFRYGYSLIALGRYEAAAAALKQGLKLDPTWPVSDFSGNRLYGPNQLAKASHLSKLAEASEAKPNDGDLLFLVGVFLHFDGQKDRAKPFFERAAQLAAGDDAHLRAFLGDNLPAANNGPILEID